MPKRTYPYQAGFRPRGLGEGFVNMGQLYTLLEDWEAEIASLLWSPNSGLKPYWGMGRDPAPVLVLFSARTTSIFYFVIK